MNSNDKKDSAATSSQILASFKKASRGKRVHTPHSKMRDTSMGSAEVSTSQENHEQVLDPD